jgi:hypothetical protein
MAFSASEVQVLRRALTVALREGRDSVDFWLLGRAIGEAQDERERLRTFMAAELLRYRNALPGTVSSFLSCLRGALDEVAYVPSAEDLAALRGAVDLPCGERERARRVALLRRCTRLAEVALEQRLAARVRRRAAASAVRSVAPDPLDILIPGRSMPLSRRVPLAGGAAPVPVAPPVTEAAPALPVAPDSVAVGSAAVDSTEVAAEAEPTSAEAVPVTIETPAAVPKTRVPESDGAESATAEPGNVDAGAPDTSPTRTRPTQAQLPTGQQPGVQPPEAQPRTTEPSPQAAEQPSPESAPKTLSPVIPHRRQGRILGQLPAPEILQTGTG